MPQLFKPLSRISSWRRIANAMWGEHKSPQVLGFDDVDMSEILHLIPKIRERTGVRVTVTHFFVKAIGEVYNRFPQLNAIVVRGQVMQRTSIDVFVQVAVPKAKGSADADLSGVKIKNVDTKSVVDIARELDQRANKVRTGEDKEIEDTKRLLDTMPGPLLKVLMKALNTASFDLGIDMSSIGVKPDPFGSGMVTNCGGFGVHAGFAPLITLARTPAIFLLGRTDDKPVVVDGEIVIRPMLRSCATFDHRLLDGYQIGLMCGLIKEFAEDPMAHPDWVG